jgi:hypothetical protein
MFSSIDNLLPSELYENRVFAVGIMGKWCFAVGIMGKSRFCCRNCGNLFVGIMGTYIFRRNCGKITFFVFSNFAVGILGTSHSNIPKPPPGGAVPP